jgi:hypothetical protein
MRKGRKRRLYLPAEGGSSTRSRGAGGSIIFSQCAWGLRLGTRLGLVAAPSGADVYEASAQLEVRLAEQVSLRLIDSQRQSISRHEEFGFCSLVQRYRFPLAARRKKRK